MSASERDPMARNGAAPPPQAMKSKLGTRGSRGTSYIEGAQMTPNVTEGRKDDESDRYG
jgi:hypothetical protein